MMFRTGELPSYGLFASGAARLADRLRLLEETNADDQVVLRQRQDESGDGGGGTGDEKQQEANAAATARWRWVERRAPVTGEAVGVLELERWVEAAPAAADGEPRTAAAAEGGGGERRSSLEGGPDDEATVTAAAAAVPAPPCQQQQQQQQRRPPRHRYLFHAAYSRTYRVPVLCFSASREDGLPLDPEQVRRDLSPWLEMHGPPPPLPPPPQNGGEGGGALGDPSWEFYLARGEHPGGLPGAPPYCYYLHPCRTAERMALLMGAREAGGEQEGAKAGATQQDDQAAAAARYLAAWLSLVSPAVGLPRPPQPEELDAETSGEVRDRR